MAKDPFFYFRIEARELLDQLARNVLDLEKGNVSTDIVQRLLRLAHTLKGAARVVRQAQIAELAHRLEELLDPYRHAASDLPRDIVDSVLAIHDAMNGQLAQIPAADQVQATSPAQAQAHAQAQAAELPAPVVRADPMEVDLLMDSLGEIGSELGAIRRSVETIESVRNLTRQLSGQQLMPQARVQAAAEKIQTALSLLERSMSSGLLRIDQELREARETAEQFRLLPISGMFNSLERTVRDAAHSTGKQVEFITRGGHVRIDSSIVDKLQNALIQLLRNAVAHGIETPSQRSTLNKPVAGRISIDVERRGYRAWFRCSDDGAGINLDAVRAALVKNGMPSADSKNLTGEALFNHLLKGGISTASAVTEISGRGIGLDLLRETMDKLNGDIVARSEPGRGTTIELSVPLLMATMEILNVEHAGLVAALPLSAVRCTLRIAADEIVHTPQGAFIVYEGSQIPMVPLRLVQSGSQHKPAQAAQRLTVVVLAVDNVSVALAVERLCGMQTVVLRALPRHCPIDPVVLAVHLDSEGNPRMVLNPDHLVAQQQTRDNWIEPVQTRTQIAPILIVDDSLTTRMLECSILESAGYAVAMAACAEDGLEMARNTSYALFLVDVDMPGMSGFDFIEQTQNDATLRAVPSILVTSRESAADRQRGQQCGARGYIIKGEFDQSEFLARVTELVQP